MMVPEPLTPLQKRIVLAFSFAIGLTRFLVVARTLFDWDEALFTIATRDYDVALHHPHPPGYPLFIALAKLVHALGVPEFRSVQTIVVLGALLIFPALFFLAREIGFDFTTSICAASMFAFLPNVWIYGGTAFSDIPATALCLTACALLLRGRHDRKAFLAGAVVLGIATGFRPPNLLIGAVPALLATWAQLRARAWGTLLAGAFLGAAIAGGSYLGAALASTSFESYLEAVRTQSQWVHDVDSYHNPGRPPLAQVAKTFLLRPVGPRTLVAVVALIGVISLVSAAWKRRVEPWLALAIFAPFAIAAWLNLDISAAPRYAISFMAGHALVAADGLRVVSRRRWIQWALSMSIVVAFIVWSWPGVQTQRTTDAPPVAALEWIARSVPKNAAVFVHGSYGPHTTAILPGRDVKFFDSPDEIPLLSGEGWVVDYEVHPGAMNFVRPRNALWKVLRQRAFEASVRRVTNLVQFGEGWYSQEGDDASAWRWMGAESHTTLPPLEGRGRLLVQFFVPLDSLQGAPVIAVEVNGVLVDRFQAVTANVRKEWVVASRKDASNDLRITTSGTVVPQRAGTGGDTRQLGLRFDMLQWTPER